MLLVKDFIEFLKYCNPNSKIILDNGEDIKHYINTENGDIVLSDKVPDKLCCKCGNPVYPNRISNSDYSYYCPNCDEDLYNIEVTNR